MRNVIHKFLLLCGAALVVLRLCPSDPGGWISKLFYDDVINVRIEAMTVHKSQGSEFEHILILLPDRHAEVVTRELIYTAITRARKRVEVWGREEVFVEAVCSRTRRVSGLQDRLKSGGE